MLRQRCWRRREACLCSGQLALAYLLDMVASWHGNRIQIGFHHFGQRWLIDKMQRTNLQTGCCATCLVLSDQDPRKADEHQKTTRLLLGDTEYMLEQ